MAYAVKRIQKPLGNCVRVGKKGYLHPTLRHALDSACAHTGASESFIIAVALAKFLGVKNQEWL